MSIGLEEATGGRLHQRLDGTRAAVGERQQVELGFGQRATETAGDRFRGLAGAQATLKLLGRDEHAHGVFA